MRSLKIGQQVQLTVALVASVALALSFVAQTAATPTPSKAGPPRVSTGNASRGRAAPNVLSGVVEPHGAATTYYFQYGPTTAYGQQTSAGTLPAAFRKFKVALVASGLVQGDHYRLVATNAYGTKTGKDRVYSRKKGSDFLLPKTLAPTVFNAPFVLSGTLTGSSAANRQLVLQAIPYPYRGAFVTVIGPVLTSANGAFRFGIAHLTTSTEFRVATLDPRPLLSGPLIEHVTVRVTLKVRSRGPKGLVRVYGTVTPAEVGARVFIQLTKPVRGNGGRSERTTRFSTQFTTVAKRATKAVSRFSAVLTILRTGAYRAYVQVRKGPLLSGSSVNIVLGAKPGSGKERRKHKNKK
jgi:hypothetical protein